MHFEEDFCRVEDESVRQNLNIVRKIALNTLNLFKEKKKLKRPLSKIMFDCLLEPQFLLSVLAPPSKLISVYAPASPVFALG